MFLGGIVREQSLRLALESSPSFDFLIESMNVIQAMSESQALVLSENEQAKAIKAAEEYYAKVKKEVGEKTSRAEAARKQGKAWAWVSVGLSLLAVLCGGASPFVIAGGAMAVAGALAVIAGLALCLAAISSVVMLMKAEQARETILELGIVRRKLETYRDRVGVHEVEDKLNELIFQIEHVQDKVGVDVDDTRVMSHRVTDKL